MQCRVRPVISLIAVQNFPLSTLACSCTHLCLCSHIVQRRKKLRGPLGKKLRGPLGKKLRGPLGMRLTFPLRLRGGWVKTEWSCPWELGRSDERPDALLHKASFMKPCFHLFCYSSYLKAQQLAPKDGRPYNQLAIVAINAVSFTSSFHISFGTTKMYHYSITKWLWKVIRYYIPTFVTCGVALLSFIHHCSSEDWMQCTSTCVASWPRTLFFLLMTAWLDYLKKQAERYMCTCTDFSKSFSRHQVCTVLYFIFGNLLSAYSITKNNGNNH